MAATRTSIFGIVYEASPRIVVWNGSTSRQLREVLDRGQVRQGLSHRDEAPATATTVASVHACCLAGVLDRAASLRPELQGQALAEARVHREIDPVPVQIALRAEVRFERDVVLRAASGGRRRDHGDRDRVAAAARKPGILRGRDRERLVVLRSAQRIVGDFGPFEPPAVVGNLRRHARNQLLLKRDSPLPVALTDTPASERLLVHLRDVARHRAEVLRVAGQRGALAVGGKVHDVAVDDLVAIGVLPVPVRRANDAGGRTVARVFAVVRRGVEVVAEIELERRPAVCRTRRRRHRGAS